MNLTLPKSGGGGVVRYRMILQYDGFAYHGWQIQPGDLTVQEVIEKVLCQICTETVKINGSGRTDQGVHGQGQVAHFNLSRPIHIISLLRALNALLPADIRILSLRKAHPDFHARRSAVCKEYRYFIWNGPCLPPFLVRYRAHVRKPLDVAAMQDAARRLVGEHDFSAFAANPSRVVESTVRNLSMLKVSRRGAEIVIRARSNGFLYRMVRSLAGFLIRVGEGEIPPEHADEILASRIRTARVPTAHPQGLFLWKVWY
jgi:tRNA pseudouridine38-40 synthase